MIQVYLNHCLIIPAAITRYGYIVFIKHAALGIHVARIALADAFHLRVTFHHTVRDFVMFMFEIWRVRYAYGRITRCNRLAEFT